MTSPRSPSLIDRFRPSRGSSPLLPFHSPPRRDPSEYDMDELDPLEPRPEDEDNGPRRRSRGSMPRPVPRSPSPDHWLDKASSAGSSSKSRQRALFPGPPPPIARSKVIPRPSPSAGSQAASRNRSVSRNSGAGSRSLLWEYRQEQQSSVQPDTAWRGLRRREVALEAEVQQLLDLQASELIKGSDDGSSLRDDEYSDTGSSTPTGTFYSTKSRMMASSLYVPTKSTPDGSVIPVRQPKPNKPRGLRTARSGIRKALAGFAQVKTEEDAHIEEALTQRKHALTHLEQLQSQREDVTTELRSLEENEEEPMGQELRQLGDDYSALTQEIKEMEEKLMAMRNKRHWIRTKMDDVKNRREAGLSGYRGALKDMDTEVTTMMRRPPVQPLDLKALQLDSDGSLVASTGGIEFLKLIPERRTLDMAKMWWESEISILERRKEQIASERQALEDGGALWSEIVSLISDYESRLRKLVKGEVSDSSAKGKDKVPSQEEMIRSQLPEMERLIRTLESHFNLAEEKHWNLLIAAIGAELEAFTEGLDLVKSILGDDEDQSQPNEPSQEDAHGYSESDNEVPSDLLVSSAKPEDSAQPRLGLQKVESSENEVPAEFLSEHKEDKVD